MEERKVTRTPVVKSPVTITNENVHKEFGENPFMDFHSNEDINDIYKKEHDELMAFVSDQINLMKNDLLFGGQSQPGIYELNQSLMNYESVMLGLIAIHAEVRSDLEIAKEKYENFYAQKYDEIKRAQVALGKSALYTAQRELDLSVRNTYMREIAIIKSELNKIENKHNTINYLISAWKDYSFILNQLGANSRAEAQAAGVAYSNQKSFGDEKIE